MDPKTKSDERKSLKVPPQLHQALHELRIKSGFSICHIQKAAVLAFKNGNIQVDESKETKLSTYNGNVIKTSAGFDGGNARLRKVLIAYIESNRSTFDLVTELEPEQ